jgi:hypothetical protein
MRAIGSAFVAMTMMISGALADTTQGALAPGKPAGTKQAQLEAGGVLLVVGIVALAAVIAIVASTTDNNSTPSTTS